MISKLFNLESSSQKDLEALRKDTCNQVDAILKELELIKKENKLLTEMVSEHQISISILVNANQNLMEELQMIYTVLNQKSGDSRRFSFTFRDEKDDDLPN